MWKIDQKRQEKIEKLTKQFVESNGIASMLWEAYALGRESMWEELQLRERAIRDLADNRKEPEAKKSYY